MKKLFVSMMVFVSVVANAQYINIFDRNGELMRVYKEEEVSKVVYSTDIQGEVKASSVGSAKTERNTTLTTVPNTRSSCEWVQLWDGGIKWAKFNIGSSITSWQNVRTYTTANIGYVGAAYIGKNYTEKADLFNVGNGSALKGWDEKYNGAKAAWGDNWTLPSKYDLEDLISKCEWTWVDGVTTKYEGCSLAGYVITGKKYPYNLNSIFLPAAGAFQSKAYEGAGEWGVIWSKSDFDVPVTHHLWVLIYDKNCYYIDSMHAYSVGCSFRPILKE